jgi:hypothetical protein
MQLGTGLVVTAVCSFHTVSQVWIAGDVLTMAQPSHIARTMITMGIMKRRKSRRSNGLR